MSLVRFGFATITSLFIMTASIQKAGGEFVYEFQGRELIGTPVEAERRTGWNFLTCDSTLIPIHDGAKLVYKEEENCLGFLDDLEQRMEEDAQDNETIASLENIYPQNNFPCFDLGSSGVHGPDVFFPDGDGMAPLNRAWNRIHNETLHTTDLASYPQQDLSPQVEETEPFSVEGMTDPDCVPGTPPPPSGCPLCDYVIEEYLREHENQMGIVTYDRDVLEELNNRVMDNVELGNQFDAESYVDLFLRRQITRDVLIRDYSTSGLEQ